jgi:hypothetical protein
MTKIETEDRVYAEGRIRRMRTQSYSGGVKEGGAYFGGSLTLFESHAWWVLGSKNGCERYMEHTRPSKIPSPVVAQLGSTFHTWSFAIFSSWSLSETSLGRIAVSR